MNSAEKSYGSLGKEQSLQNELDKSRNDPKSVESDFEPQQCTTEQYEEYMKLKSAPMFYAGRLGGNQEFVLDPSDPDAVSILRRTPDAAPWLSVRSILSLDGFRQFVLWKAALMEAVGTFILCYVTIIANSSPALNIQPVPVPSGPAGIFGTANFLGPLVGAVLNIFFISLLIFGFGSVTGAHLNPMITIATFFCRLTTLPRMVLYVVFQTAGASLAGLMVRASLNTTAFKTGGCFFDPHTVTTGQMFAVEFSGSVAIIFLAFGVGLDPRQASTFGPALAPILVGCVVGAMTLATAFAVPGFGGSGTNPGRCFGVWVGSGRSLGVTAASEEFGYTGPNGDRVWIYWVAAVAASIFHSFFYLLLPPWSATGGGTLELKKPVQQGRASAKSRV